MGSTLRLTVIADPMVAAEAWRITRDVFAAADSALSRFRSDSALVELNLHAGGQIGPVLRLLRRALALAWRAYRVTDGLFDPRIIGALERAGEHAHIPLPPSPTHLRAHEPWLRLSRRGAAVSAPIDLGGIGKGLALRWVRDALWRNNYRRFLIDAGGDIVASGVDIDGKPWAVALANPDNASRLPHVLELTDEAVASSGTAIRRWQDAEGRWQHHIIDPRTSAPAVTQRTQATVVHQDPAWAEIWSKVHLITGEADVIDLGIARPA